MSDKITKAELLVKIEKLEKTVNFYVSKCQDDSENVSKMVQVAEDVQVAKDVQVAEDVTGFYIDMTKKGLLYTKYLLESDDCDEVIENLCVELFQSLWGQINEIDFDSFRDDSLDFDDLSADVHLSCNELELNSIYMSLEDMNYDELETVEGCLSFQDILDIDDDGNCTYKGRMDSELIEVVVDLELVDCLNNGFAFAPEIFEEMITKLLKENFLLQEKTRELNIPYQVSKVMEYASDSIGETPITVPRAILGIANYIKDIYIVNDLKNAQMEFTDFDDYSIEVNSNQLSHISCLDISGENISRELSCLEDISLFENLFTTSIKIFLKELAHRI